MKLQDGAQARDGVLGGGSTGALVIHLVGVARAIKFALERIGIGLAGLQAIAGGNAVAEADQYRAAGCEALTGCKQKQGRND